MPSIISFLYDHIIAHIFVWHKEEKKDFLWLFRCVSVCLRCVYSLQHQLYSLQILMAACIHSAIIWLLIALHTSWGGCEVSLVPKAEEESAACFFHGPRKQQQQQQGFPFRRHGLIEGQKQWSPHLFFLHHPPTWAHCCRSACPCTTVFL